MSCRFCIGHPCACGPEPARSVYLAGGSSERLTVCRPLIDRLTAAGVPIAYDWTRDPGWSHPGGESFAEACADAAHRDLDAVRSCEILWYVAPEDRSEGSAAELGAALALGRTVIASGPHALAHGRIFPLLAGRTYPTHEDAFRVVVAMSLRIEALGHNRRTCTG